MLQNCQINEYISVYPSCSRHASGLALIHRSSIPARPLKLGFNPTSFELQLIGLQVSNVLVKFVNVYRPPGNSKVTFLEEFGELLAEIGLGIGERLVICGDFNMPGVDQNSIDDGLRSLLDVHGFTQHVDEPTRNQSLLDLVITPAESSHPLISNIAVRSSHHLSDHCLVVCDLSVRRFKAPAVSYSFRNIREVDVAEFHKRLRTHELFIDPADTPDEYLGQLEHAVKTVLDELAPVCHGKRAGGRKGARWLEPQAVEAKKLRRRLERRWKKYGSEFDRIAYRATCRRANLLINQSRNRHRYQHVVDAGNNPRSVWSAVKDLLYTNQSDKYIASTDDDSTFCSTLATFFHNKIQNIKSAILLALEGQCFDPLASDSPTDKLLSEFSQSQRLKSSVY